jgi:hypothetical protein
MPRTCTICTHPKRTAIEQALGQAIPLRTIAAQWSVSKTALIRHKTDHLPERSRHPSPAISQHVLPVERTTRRTRPLRQTGRAVAPSTATTIAPAHETAAVLFPEILHPQKRAFLTAFVTCGRRGLAAAQAGVKHQHYLYWFATDPEFCAVFARAERLCGHLIEDAIFERGVVGVDVPVYDANGDEIGTRKKHSDTLLIFAAKGNMKEKYGQLGTVTHDTSPQLTALLGYWAQIRQEASTSEQIIDAPVEDAPDDWQEAMIEESEGPQAYAYDDEDEEPAPLSPPIEEEDADE